MSLPKKLLRQLQDRDSHCWHCGTDQDLVPHHRKNRQAGGSKHLDNLLNVIMVCAQYNFEMEAVAEVAAMARVYKHKLRQTDTLHEPVFDRYQGKWFNLFLEGDKIATDSGTPPF